MRDFWMNLLQNFESILSEIWSKNFEVKSPKRSVLSIKWSFKRSLLNDNSIKVKIDHMTKRFNELFPHRKEQPEKHPTILTRIFRVIYDSTRGFIEDDCYTKASALTFYSLLSIVPLLAVVFGIAKGFGLESGLELGINERFGEHHELWSKLTEFANSWLQTVKGGVIAGFGVFILFWAVLGLLSSIETILNSIWKMPISRGFGRRMSDYLAAMVICPFFLITSSSLTLWLTNWAHTEQGVIAIVVNPLIIFLIKLFPFVLSWVLFTFIYFFLPNTKVYLRSAIIAGILAGTAFQLMQWIYIKFQIGATSYGAIYGSFAALPLFLIWLQMSWLILLGGAELAFEIENDLFIPYRRTTNLSVKAAALLVTYRCIEAFVKGEPPQTDRSLAHELGISLNHLHTLLEPLQQERILTAASFKDKTIGYQPARAIDTITYSMVCLAIDKSNDLLGSVRDSPPFQRIQEYLKLSDHSVEEAGYNTAIYDGALMQ